jgi:hypothetical protein
MQTLEYCSTCGLKYSFLTTAWRMDRYTNESVKVGVSDCCHSDACSHRKSVELRLTKVGKRMVKEQVNKQLIDTLLDMGTYVHDVRRGKWVGLKQY